jgi:hypothetical protein
MTALEDTEKKMQSEQKVNDNLLTCILNYISHATDLLERQFVLDVADKDVKNYVLSMEKFGLFNNWWTEKELQKEAKQFLKDPKKTAVSTLKQEVFGSIDGQIYTLFFHLKCPAEHYYKSIRKNKMSYLINNSKLTYMKLEKFDREEQKDIIVFEQGINYPVKDPFAKIHHAKRSIN